MAASKKPTHAERITTVEVKVSNDRKKMNYMHDEIKEMDVKLDGMVLSLATFETSLPQLIGDYLEKLANRRNRKWLTFAIIAGTITTLGSLFVAIVTVSR